MRASLYIVWLAWLWCCPAAAETPLTHEVFGTRVAPPPELAGLRVGMPAHEARRAAPKLVPTGKSSFKTTPSSIAGMKFEVHLSLDYRTVDSFGVILPEGTGELVMKAWGPGIARGDGCSLWLNPDTKVRAVGCKGVMDPIYLVWFSTFGTFETLLVAGKPGFGFESQPLLGEPIDKLRKVYGSALTQEKHPVGLSRQHSLLLPLVEWEERTRIDLTLSGGQVSSFSFWLNWQPNPAKSRDELLRALETAWGKGQPHPRYKEELYWFDPVAGRRLCARADRGGFVIRVEPYLPVAKLLGDSLDRLRVETRPILGATWEQLVAAYPDWIDPSDEHKRLWLLPTEWDTGTAITLVFDRKGHVARYSVSEIEWGPDRPTVEALLDARSKGARPFNDRVDDQPKLEIRTRDPRVVLVKSAASWWLEVGDFP